MDALPTTGAELLGAIGLTVVLVAGFRRGWPMASTWLFVIVSGSAGQLSSLLIMMMQGHETSMQHIAYHVVLGILASGSDKVVNVAHVGAEIKKNGEGRIPSAG